jgi:hypothetical protein
VLPLFESFSEEQDEKREVGVRRRGVGASFCGDPSTPRVCLSCITNCVCLTAAVVSGAPAIAQVTMSSAIALEDPNETLESVRSATNRQDASEPNHVRCPNFHLYTK